MTDGWCPFADKKEVEKRWRGNSGRFAVVDHVAEGSYHGTIGWFLGNSKTSAHFLIGSDGELAQFVSIHDSAWANGLGFHRGRYIDPAGRIITPPWGELKRGRPGYGINPNKTTISIERAGFHTTPWSDAQRATHAKLLAWIGEKYPALLPYEPGRSLIGHRDISPIQKANCPGPTTDLARNAREANALLGHVPPPSPVYANTSLILGTSMVKAKQAIKHIRAHPGGNGEYTEYDVGAIVRAYIDVCARGGVDWTMALAQCLHETAYLSSYWAGRERRNPAGLGVTGEEGKGLWFPTWANDGIPAHIGRLLAYRFREDKKTITAEQQSLIAFALHWRPLPSSYRGCAVTWEDLNGRWNEKKTNYAHRVAEIANVIRTTSA